MSRVDFIRRFHIDILESFDCRFVVGTFFYVFEYCRRDKICQDSKFIEVFFRQYGEEIFQCSTPVNPRF